ncbi:MAG: ABC transporter permease, partial [Zavarzinia sp.]|nr:ABC transporter permease [Zavarzinia sp.]
MGSLIADFRHMFARYGVGVGAFIAGTVTLWVFVLIVLPQISMVLISFSHNLPPAERGGPNDVFTLSQYGYFLFGNDGGFNTLHLTILGKTVMASVIVTVFDLILCYPIAFLLAHGTRQSIARLMVIGLIVPYWINEVLRAFAFRILFGSTGLVNGLGQSLGLWSEPIDFIREDVALYAGLTYAYILLMIFPIYNAIEALDRNQIEAARDMGAPWWRIHWRVVIPMAKPGIASGATMVFMLTTGAMAAPQILGGPSNLWFTQLVYQWFNDASNWQRGSAYAVILVAVCILFTLLMMR